MKRYALVLFLCVFCLTGLLSGCAQSNPTDSGVPQSGETVTSEQSPLPNETQNNSMMSDSNQPQFPGEGFLNGAVPDGPAPDGAVPGGPTPMMPGMEFHGGDFPQPPDAETGNILTADPENVPAEQNASDLFSDRDLDSNPDLSAAVSITAQDDTRYRIEKEGIYTVTGQASDFTIVIETDKNDKVQIVLDNVSIENRDFPVIYVKSADKCFVTLMGDNYLSTSSQFTSDGDINTDAVIFSKDDLTLNGSGSLTIVSAAGNGITSKDDLVITDGKYTINSAKDAVEANDMISVYDGEFYITTAKDGFHCENDEEEGEIFIQNGVFVISAQDDGIQATTLLTIDGGEFQITAVEGLEATYVRINEGIIRINASDDGINASRKSGAYDVVIEINGGEITIVMGPGDTDGLDANGTIIVNGGIIDVTGQSTFDADLGSIYNGGTIIINGTTVDSIPSSQMGGHGGKGDGFQGFKGNKSNHG